MFEKKTNTFQIFFGIVSNVIDTKVLMHHHFYILSKEEKITKRISHRQIPPGEKPDYKKKRTIYSDR